MCKWPWNAQEIKRAAAAIEAVPPGMGPYTKATVALDAAGAIPRREYEALRDAAATFAITVAKQDAPAGERVTDEMVERAAQALWLEGEHWRRRHPDLVVDPFPYERLVEPTQRDLRTYARAALEAALLLSAGSVERPGVYHVDGAIGQIRQMARWADREGGRVYPDRETLRKIATNLWAAADALGGSVEQEGSKEQYPEGTLV